LRSNPGAGAERHSFGSRKILLGLLIAAVGAVSVMCYIVGISDLYFGKYIVGSLLLLGMGILGFLFWRAFSTYVLSLMDPEEAKDVMETKIADQLGLGRVLAFGTSMVALVLLAHSAFFAAHNSRWLSLAGAALAGLLSLRFWTQTREPKIDV